jgi:ABC-type transport system involved in multi-copper enzyme maturation permease subunit
MRAILVLVKREIIDHVAYLVGAAIASGLITALMATMVLSDNRGDMEMETFAGLIPALLFVIVGLCALGVAQMYTDRNRNISAFLMALPVTRGQIFAARVLAGLLAVLVLVLPLAVAGAVLMDLRTGEVPLYAGLLGDLFWGILLMCLACYSVGLYAGWNRRSLAPTLAVLPVVLLLPLLIVVKGFGIELVALLLLFIVSCLAATWCRFSSSSL